MKITAISDIHGNLIDIAPCDILLICGDISPLEIQRDHIQMTKWIFGEFYEWIMKLPCDQVVLTPGNHDFWFEKFLTQSRVDLFNKLTILIDDGFYINIDGKPITIYGTPWIRPIGRIGVWAFEKDPTDLKKLYNKMPHDIDILITHDAPALGYVGIEVHGKDVMHFTNEVLANEIKNKKPKYAICGHIHEGKHKLDYIEISESSDKDIEIVNMANCSILDDSYSIKYEPLTFEL